MEMGLLPGTEIRVIRHTRVGGLVQLEVRGCNLSLRHSEAEALMLETRAA
jgi:ferrous iron transport protein A